jgi:hypothetical protein
MGNSISVMETKKSADLSAIRSGQEEFEEKITGELDKQLKGVVNVVKQQTQKLGEGFDSELQGTRRVIGVARQCIEVARRDTETTRRDRPRSHALRVWDPADGSGSQNYTRRLR